MSDGASILEAVGIILADMESRTGARLGVIANDCTAQIEAAIAQLPEPQPGAPGRDGVDRIMAAPRFVRSGEACPANELACWQNGIWQSVRATGGDPGEDPFGWRCLVPGIHGRETRQDWQTRETVSVLQLSDNTFLETRTRMAPMVLPSDYLVRSIGVLAGDTRRNEAGDMEYMALVDGADEADSESWRETRLRGFRGQKGPKGERGDRGPAGAGLVDFTLVDDPARGQLALVPRFSDPAIKGQPIMIERLLADPPAGRLAITCWAGRWNAAKSYTRGDVVGDGQGRMLISLKSDNAARLSDPGAWEAMT